MNNFGTLIGPAELAALKFSDYALFDCRFDLTRPQWGAAVYADGHLPRARYLHLDRDLSAPLTPQSGRHPLPAWSEFTRRLGRWGIRADTQVVAYDQGNGMVAARLWWMLRWVGHSRVAVLDGGVAAWIAAGYELTSATTEPPSARDYVAAGVSAESIDVIALQRRLSAGGALLIDARGTDRFAGENETIDPVAGHIPGAVNHPFTGNLDERGRFLSAAALRDRWQSALGAHTTREVIATCGSGVSACHNLLALEHAGLGLATLYPGSWSEWIRDPARPVATGNS